MALPSYYTPVKPYAAPRSQGQQVQNQLYRALAQGNGAALPDGGTATTPPPPQPPSVGTLTPINNSIDTAEGISLTRGSGPGGRASTGAGAAATGPSSPAPAAASSGGGGGGGGGWSFDFSGDPILARIRAYNQMLLAQASSSALAQRKQSEIGYGYDPNIKYEDPATAEAARQNTFSTIAQLLFNHGERGHSLDESLNKSNLFYSGERARQLGLEGRQYTLEQSNANQGFQGTMNQIAQALLGTQMSAQEREIQAESDAYNRALQFALANGGAGGGGGSGGGGGGTNLDDFIRGHNQTGMSDADLLAIAQRNAPSGQTPHDIAHEGEITTDENGRPGITVKYDDPNGGTNTIWIPLG